MSSGGEIRCVVTAEDAGRRLDLFVAGALETPRNRVQRWIREGLVSVDGTGAKPSRILSEGETVTCSPPSPGEDRVLPETGELVVLFEDDALVVLNKPAGLAMHPGAGRPGGTLANRLLGRYPEMAGVGGSGRPGIVHRLDIDTTGVVVTARSDAAYRALSEAFNWRRVEKYYLAVCYGALSPPAGSMEASIGRHPKRRTEMAVRPTGRPSRTDYSTLESIPGASLLRLNLLTGRTHQIRVHLKYAGHPLIGDPTYGEARWKALPPTKRPLLRDFGRPALHAWKLAFDHPLSGERLQFTAPPPGDLVDLWAALGGTQLLH